MEQKIPDNFKFLYKKDKPLFIKILSLILGIMALAMIWESPLTGSLFFIVALALFLLQEGIQVIFTEKKYRTFTTFRIATFGKWKKLPPISYISVFKERQAAQVSSITANYTLRLTFIQVNLITEDKRRINLYTAKSEEEAFAFAKDVSEKLKLRVFDATSDERKFIS
jgi:hypothetical protein